jgi:hypothetical protein
MLPLCASPDVKEIQPPPVFTLREWLLDHPSCAPVAAPENFINHHGGKFWQCGAIKVSFVNGLYGLVPFSRESSYVCSTTINGIPAVIAERLNTTGTDISVVYGHPRHPNRGTRQYRTIVSIMSSSPSDKLFAHALIYSVRPHK